MSSFRIFLSLLFFFFFLLLETKFASWPPTLGTAPMLVIPTLLVVDKVGEVILDITPVFIEVPWEAPLFAARSAVTPEELQIIS